MDELPYSEGLEYLHCVYFDNGIEVKRTNNEAENQGMLKKILELKNKLT
tara:strand:+ start:366 stop:512 length:147 start_codon:yes stop_codon:yes gene_type:complete